MSWWDGTCTSSGLDMMSIKQWWVGIYVLKIILDVMCFTEILNFQSPTKSQMLFGNSEA